MRRKGLLIVAIILMSIGFAAVSTTLVINGNAKVKENQDDFDVIFTAANLDNEDVYNEVISEDKKTITFRSKDLKKLNDTSVLKYEVTNNSSNYDAEVRINCGVKENTEAKYTSISNVLEGNVSIVKAKESVNGTLTITLNKTATKEVTEEYTCTLEFNALERTELGVEPDKLAEPLLTNELVPVTIEDNGSVKKADTTKEWYNYENKIWANAVILEENANYKEGDIIKESDIQSYFVWIPRYRYKLFNTDDYSLTTVTSAAEVESKAQEIEIEFEDKTTKASTGSKKGEWLTHPAFTSFDTNGLWVGKYETGYKGAASVTGAQVNATDTSKVIIKPNVYSWRNITVKNIFETSYNYKREMDSHMMKNTEWGAVAYLSHSKYGINTELNINNNSSYKTGYSALKSTNQQIYPGEYGDGEKYNQPYNTEIGYLASTTGNISGVYDMSGGAHEYVSAYRSGTMGSSGFSTTTIANYDNKYFDVYNESSTMTTYQYRILGDATGEMGPFNNYLDGDNTSRYHNSWYNDASDFITLSEPWFNRGGGYDNGVLASQFYFHRYTGGRHSNLGFRLVLTP